MITYPMNDRDFGAEDVALYHATRTSGVFDGGDFECTVTGADNNVTVGPGLAWIRESRFAGRVAAERTETVLDMGVADATYPRIDAVVLRYETGLGASLAVKNGVAAAVPVPPQVVRTEAVIELHLYHVRREAGASSIPVGALTDLRTNSQYCGLMQDAVTPRDAGITAENMPVVPMSKGGTGAQEGSEGLKNLLAAGYMQLSGYQIVASVDDIPEDAPEGAVFFVPEE